MFKKCLRLVLLAALLVPLGAKAQSQCEAVVVTSTSAYFEGFEGTALPDCWTVSGPGSWSVGTGDHSTSTGAHSGSGNARITHGTTGNVTTLISPVFDLSGLTGASLTFWYINRSWGSDVDGLEVLFRSDTTATWTVLDNYTNGTSEWTEATFNLTTVSATCQVAFRYTDHWGYGVGIDDVRLGPPATCFRVQNIAASDIAGDGMTIHWTDTLNTSTYTLTYWPANATSSDDTVTVQAISDTSYALTNLESNTTYFFSVVPDCSDGSIAARSGSAKTLCSVPACSIGLTLSGNSYYYSHSYIDVMQDSTSIGHYDSYYNFTTNYTLEVCPTSPISLVWDGLGSGYASSSTIVMTDGGGTEVYNSTLSGITPNTYFYTTANPCPSCMPPTALADSVDEEGNVILMWNHTDAGSYLVYAGDSLYTESAISDTFYVFNDLTPSTIYQLGVANVCGSEEGDTSGIARLSVATPCGAISAMPWNTSFETDEANGVPLCWTVLDSTENYGDVYPSVYNYSYYAYTGTKSLYMRSSYDDEYNYIVSPAITYQPNNIHVKFAVNADMYDGGTFQAGITTNPASLTAFHPYVTITSANYEYDYVEKEFYTSDLDLEEGDTIYLAFRLAGPENGGSWNYSYVFLDDISMVAIPNCRMPLSGSGSIDSVSYNSAFFSWEGDSEDGYDLMLTHYTYNDTTGAVIDTIVEHFFSDSTFISVGTLLSNTYYEAAVATLCLNDDSDYDTTEYLVIGYLTTQLRCYPVYQASVDAVTASAATLSWHYLPGMGIAPAGAMLTLTDLSDATAAPVVENVLADSTKTYTGLTVGHNYKVTLTTLCGTTDSAEMQTLFFTPHAPACEQYYTDAQASSTGSSAPAYTAYKNFWSQTIYADSVLADLGSLTGVAYKSTFGSYNTPGVINTTVDLFLGYVDTADLTLLNGQYYLPAYISVDSGMTKVASAYHMSITGNGWVYIPFDSSFAVSPRNDGKRLVVTAVGSIDSRENSSCSWVAVSDYTYTSTYTYYYKSRYGYNNYDTVHFNPSTISGGYGTSYVPNIQFFGDCEQGCVAPNASASATTGNSITVQWLANGEETSWKVEYKLPADTAWTLATTATASPYTISGLTAGTGYQLRVGAVCTDTVVYCAPFTAFTACVAVVPPYSVVFTTANPCWTASNSPNATNGYNVWSSNYLISPEMGVSLDTLAITITDRCYNEFSANQRYYIFACDADGSNRVPIDTIAATEGSNFGTHTVYLMNYSGTQNHFGFAAAGGDVYIKGVSIDYLSSCMPAGNVTLDTATPNTMTLSWTSHSPNNGFTVNYRLAGDTAWSTASATGTTVTLTGLNSSSRYEVQVVTNCNDGTTMSTAVSQFATECVPLSIPYNQTYFFAMPACWNNSYTGHPSTTWEQSMQPQRGYTYSYAPGSNNPIDDWLMTPAIVIPATAAADSVMVIYQIAGDAYYTSSLARYEMLVAPNGGNTYADFTDTLLVDTVLNEDFEYRRLSLAAYAGDTIRLAFRSTCTYYGSVYMYDFGVRSILTPRYYLTGSANVFVGDTNGYKAIREEGDTNTVTFTWTSTMAAAGNATMTGETTDSLTIIYTADGIDTLLCVVSNSYGVDTNRGYVRVIDLAPVTTLPYFTGFESTDRDNNSWVLVNGTNAWTIGTAAKSTGNQSLYISNDDGAHNVYNNSTTTNSFAYRAFNFSDTGDYVVSFDWRAYGEGNTYSNYDYLRAWMAPDSSFHVAANATPTTTGWKELGGELNLDSTWNTWTDSIHISTPGRYFLTFMWRNDYSVGTNPPAAIDNIVVSNGSIPTCDAPAIDTVLAAETSILMGFSSEAESFEVAIVEGQWTEPLVGDTVITDTTYTFTGLTAATAYTVGVRAVCAEGLYSEWVVSNITTEAHPCDVPTALTSSNVTLNSATLGWTSVEGQSAWQIHLTGEGYDRVLDANANPFPVSGLDHGVTYTFTVRAICGEGDTSAWSTSATFTTLACEAPTNVTVGSVTSNSAVVSWTAPAGATRFIVNYGKRGFSQGTGSFDTVENATRCTLSGLEANMNYDVYVMNVCGEGVQSNWSAVAQFTTERTGIDDVVNAAISLYPNPASSTVTLKGIEGKATVTVVDMNGRKAGEWTVNDGSLTIDVTEMAQGAYFVRIVGEQVNAIRKLIVR